MRWIRILTTALFTVIFAVWVITGAIEKKNIDKYPPVITADSDRITLSVEDGEKKLLEGLKAVDAGDGDLTDQIMVSGYSKFSPSGEIEVNYVVFDSRNNFGQYTRTVNYTDYQSPEFSLSAPLVFDIGDNVSVMDRLKLTDSIDGDISYKIRIVSDSTDNTQIGTYQMGVEGVSAYGDAAAIEIPVLITPHTYAAPEIVLSTYLTYIDQYEIFHPEKYLEKVILADGTEVTDLSEVEMEYQVNIAVPGCYQAVYSYKDVSGATGYTCLGIIVRE